jgi:hypothetical protein
MTERTPDWLVERLHAGDLSADEAAAVRRRLEAEGGLSRLDELARDDAAFRIVHPAAPAVEEIRRRAGRAPRRLRPLQLAIPALAAAAAAALVVLVPRPGGDGTREKGLAAHLEVYRQAQPDALQSGATARAGDLLQLAYVAAGAPYGVIVSVDGRGAVTLHWPEGGGPAARLEGPGAVPLTHAYQLDDAPRFERFFIVTGDAPFDSGAVVEAAKRLAASGAAETAPLALPRGLEQKAIVLRKP